MDSMKGGRYYATWKVIEMKRIEDQLIVPTRDRISFWWPSMRLGRLDSVFDKIDSTGSVTTTAMYSP